MKKGRMVKNLLLLMALTLVLGGCKDKKDEQKESLTDNRSQEANRGTSYGWFHCKQDL